MPTTDKLKAIALCPSCDLLIKKRALPSGVKARCPRCHSPLYQTPYVSINSMIALCIAAILFYIPANLYPVLELNFMGNLRTATVFQGAMAVIEDGFWFVGITILIAAIIAPGILLLSILSQLLIVKFGLHSRTWKRLLIRLLRIHDAISQLSMLEIYVLSFLVSAFQLSDFAEVHFAVGTFCFTMLFLSTFFLQHEYSQEQIWEQLHE